MTVYSGFFKLLKNTQQKESVKDSFLNPALQHHGKTVTSLLRPLYLTTFKPPGKTAIYYLVKKTFVDTVTGVPLCSSVKYFESYF